MSNTTANRTIGVMGGLGPAATVDFMRHVVTLTATKPVRMVVDCDPTIPDVSAAILGTGPSCADALVRMATGLEAGGAEIVVLACNAAHHYEVGIRAALGVPFLSMIDVAAEAAAGAKCVGLLAAESCLVSGVYQRALASRGMTTITLPPEANAAFNEALVAIRAGDVGPARKADMLKAIELLAEAGATAVILGCTEVPLVVSQTDTSTLLIDPGAVLARAVVGLAVNSN